MRVNTYVRRSLPDDIEELTFGRTTGIQLETVAQELDRCLTTATSAAATVSPASALPSQLGSSYSMH